MNLMGWQACRGGRVRFGCGAVGKRVHGPMLESRQMERFQAKHDGLILSLLNDHLPSWKRNHLKQKLRAKLVQVNGQTVSRHDAPVQAGDWVEIVAQAALASTGPRTIGMGIRVVYEDAYLVVVDKPAGLLAVSSAREREKTALAIVRAALQAEEKRNVRVWPVHRIDRGTSGLLMIARSLDIREAMQSMWSQVHKQYLAVLEGVWPQESGKIEQPLREGKDLQVYVAPQSREAKHAVTHFRVRTRFNDRTALEVWLETGRKHQIRVHFAHAGHPLLGDVQYGAAPHALGRPALHAQRLHFPHPRSRQRIELESPIPADLRALLRTSAP